MPCQDRASRAEGGNSIYGYIVPASQEALIILREQRFFPNIRAEIFKSVIDYTRDAPAAGCLSILIDDENDAAPMEFIGPSLFY